MDVPRASAREWAIKAIRVIDTVGFVQVVGADPGGRLQVIGVDDIVCAIDIVGVHSSNRVVSVVGIVNVVGVVRRVGAEGGGIQVGGTVDLVRIVDAVIVSCGCCQGTSGKCKRCSKENGEGKHVVEDDVDGLAGRF